VDSNVKVIGTHPIILNIFVGFYLGVLGHLLVYVGLSGKYLHYPHIYYY